MPGTSGKRTAKVKVGLTRRAIEALRPQRQAWIAWDTQVTGFGVRVHPTGTKSYIVNYRPGGGGRRAPNRRIAIGRADSMAPDTAPAPGAGAAGPGRPGGGPGRVAGHHVPPSDARGGLRGVPDGQPGPQGADREVLPRPDAQLLLGLADTVARLHRAPGGGGALPPGLEASRPDRRQPRDLAAALGVPPAVRGLRGPAQPRRAVARRGRALPPRRAAAHLRAVRGAAAVAPGDRGGGPRAGDPRHLLVRGLHGAARQRGVRPELGPGEPFAAPPADRRDQDRETAAPAGHPATRGRPRAAAGRLSGWACGGGSGGRPTERLGVSPR